MKKKKTWDKFWAHVRNLTCYKSGVLNKLWVCIHVCACMPCMHVCVCDIETASSSTQHRRQLTDTHTTHYLYREWWSTETGSKSKLGYEVTSVVILEAEIMGVKFLKPSYTSWDMWAPFLMDRHSGGHIDPWFVAKTWATIYLVNIAIQFS